jgi:hypothetical protein
MIRGLGVLTAVYVGLCCTTTRAEGQVRMQLQVSARVLSVDTAQFALVQRFGGGEVFRLPISGGTPGEVRVSQAVDTLADDRSGRRERRTLTISYVRN